MSTLAERFWAKVELGPGCWCWKGYCNRKGYGVLRATDKNKLATHVCWFLRHGRWPSLGECVLHSCDHPSCVNPAHLRIGSNAENVADRERKGRNKPPSGEACPKAKLTTAKVLEIRSRVGEPHKRLAAEFGVSISTLRAARIGNTWRHVGADRSVA